MPANKYPQALSLDDLLTATYAWSRTEDPDVLSIKAFKQPAQEISFEQLRKMDPRLPFVVEYLLSSSDQAPGIRIGATLLFWNTASPVKTRLFNFPEEGDQYVLQIRRVRPSEKNEQQVNIYAAYVNVESINGHAIVTSKVMNAAQDVSYTWLEEHYPGSVARFLAGSAVQMGQVPLAEYMFYTPCEPLLDITLSDEVVFD